MVDIIFLKTEVLVNVENGLSSSERNIPCFAIKVVICIEMIPRN